MEDDKKLKMEEDKKIKTEEFWWGLVICYSCYGESTLVGVQQKQQQFNSTHSFGQPSPVIIIDETI